MKTSIPPCPQLRPYIDRYWGWEGEYRLPKLLPGTGHELVFHYSPPYFRENNDTLCPLPGAYLLTVRHSRHTLRPNGPVGIIAVRFRAGAFRHFCRQSVADLADNFVAPRHIWGQNGDELTERVIARPGFEQRVAVLEAFLLKILSRHAKTDLWLDRAIRDIYYRHGSLRLREKCRDWGVSSRQLQRKFRDAVGAGPKQFQLAARFQAVTKRLLLDRQSDYLGVILANGYFDQAHFIKDFRRFAGETPSAFLQEENFSAHFYNKSFPACSIL